jgi:lipoate-protein ligase A
MSAAILPHTAWRLVQTPPARGAWNMAVDEALLESVGKGASLPALRLYAWDPPCLSLGYAQPAADVDILRLAEYGWDIVRRPTGGRAILHTDELTYAVIGPQDEPRLQGGVLESYRRLSAALLEALRRLGLPVRSQERDESAIQGGEQGPVCFETPSTYEITAGGKKLVGSAQARRREGVLQHGTLPLAGDLRRITHALAFRDEDSRRQAGERVLSRATTIEQITGRVVSWEAAAGAFREAFQESLNLEFQPGDLTAAELQRAAALVQEKYDNPGWTNRV